MNKVYFSIPLFVNADSEDDSYERRSDLDNNPDVLQLVADNWNSEGVHQYLSLSTEYRPDVMGEGIIDSHAFVQDNELIVEIETDHMLSNNEIIILCDEISGQCSDGWGEGFEQFPRYYQREALYISTWKYGANRAVKYLADFERK